MLYKYYRYILIVKILFLLVGGYILLHEWDVSNVRGGTVFIVDRQPGDAVNRIDTILQKEKLPEPWSIIGWVSWAYSVHVPWTYDTGYVARYIKRPIPFIDQYINKDIYEDNCQKKVELTAYGSWRVENCNLWIHYNTLTAIVLIVLWLVL